MKYCSKCGAQLNDDVIYCPLCGDKVVEEKEFVQTETYVSNNQYVARRNVCALLGFIFAFISPLAGWILSGIGLRKAKEFNGDRKNLAIWGIVIASINFVIGIIVSIYLQPYLDELLQELQETFISF